MATNTELLGKALKAAGGQEEFERQYVQYGDSLAFLDKKRSELLQKYDGDWVAVFNSRIIAHGKQYSDVVKQIVRSDKPIGKVVIKFLSSKKIATLFWG